MDFTTLKDQILDTLSKLPNLSNKELYALYPKGDQGSIRNYKSLFKKSITNTKNIESVESVIVPEKKNQIISHKTIKNKVDPDTIDDPNFIDDPDKLLMDLSMSVLNKQRYELLKNGVIPSNQWANVLITTRKERIGTSKKESRIRSKFKSMNIKDIAMILDTKQKDISPKSDLEACEGEYIDD